MQSLEKTNAFGEVVVVVIADLISSHTTTNVVSLTLQSHQNEKILNLLLLSNL
jgi:hypothetical protein